MNIIITGASRGIGYELAKEFSRHGNHNIILISRFEKDLLKIKKDCLEVNPHSEITIIPADFSQVKSIDTTVIRITEKISRIDILINNAGLLIKKPARDISPEEIQSMLDVNFLSPALLIKGLVPVLENAQKPHVVNICSMGGFQGSSKFPGLAYYSASKAALAVLTECLASDYKSSGISFNALALGAVQTEMLESAFPGYKAPVKTRDMAKFIMEFSLNAHSVMNGKIIPVNLGNP